MDTVCRSFASRLERRRTLLITSVRFHRLTEEVILKVVYLAVQGSSKVVSGTQKSYVHAFQIEILAIFTSEIVTLSIWPYPKMG